MARGISTVLGALLFTVVAMLFIALALRVFTESTATLTEVASVNARNAVEERLEISVSYTRSVKLTASQAGATVTPLWGTEEGDETLLDLLDGSSLNLVSSSTQAGQQPQQPQSRELVRNGGFSEREAYWKLGEPWRVDATLQCARVNTTAQSIVSSLWQTVDIPLGLQKLTLNFSYYLYASPQGQVGSLSVTVEILQDGLTVWSASVVWDRNRNPTEGVFSQSVPVGGLSPGPAIINFTLRLSAGQNLRSLDIRLDDVSLLAESLGAPPSPVSAAYLAAARIDLASASGNCTLTAALNASGFMEVYVPAAEGVWVTALKYYVERGYEWFNVTFAGSASIIYAYSASPFKLMLDYLQVEGREVSPTVDVSVANRGTEPVTIYAVWLNGTRKDVERVLLSGMLLNVPFDISQLVNPTGFEVRVVTATRTHTVRFAVEQLPLQQPMPVFRIVSWDQTVSGPAGSQQRFTVTVRNGGSAPGDATVKVFDHTSAEVASSALTLQPGEQGTVELLIQLPAEAGVYTWRVKVLNQATGRVDDSRSFTVVATVLLPTFSIVSWNESIAGPAGSQQRFVAVVQNNGGTTGIVEVRVLDSEGVVVGSAQLEIPPGQQGTATLTVTLPPAMGTYTWTVVALNTVSGNVDDTKSFTVTAQQPKFSIVSWSENVAGPVGSKREFSAVIENIGNGEGSVTVEVRDHNGVLINSSTLTLQPGGQGVVKLTVTLPLVRGTYTWTAVAVNAFTGEIDDSKSFIVYAMDLYLKVRGAVCYAPFEALPIGWSWIGGTWSIAAGSGVEGSALQGVDNSRGPGGTSVYYWATGISAYTSLQAVVQVRVTSVDSVYRGIVLLQDASSASRLYEASVRPRRVGVNHRITVYIRRWTGGWATLTSWTVSYASGWYTLYVSWSRSGNTNTINAVLYDSSGNQVASVSRSDSQVTVNYFGLDVDGGTSLFDNFVLSTSDPRYVVVSGLQQGWSVELRDAGGVLVASAIADSSGVARLFIAARPIVLNAKIAVKDSLNNVVVEKDFNEVVGGDEYAYGP